MKMCSKRKAGRRQLYPSHGLLRFITSHSRFAFASSMRETKRLRRRLLERGFYSGEGAFISGGGISGGAYYRQFTVNRWSRLCDAGLGHNLRVYKLLLPLKVSSLLGTKYCWSHFIQNLRSLHKSVAPQSPKKSDFSVSDPGGSEETELTEKSSFPAHTKEMFIISTYF